MTSLQESKDTEERIVLVKVKEELEFIIPLDYDIHGERQNVSYECYHCQRVTSSFKVLKNHVKRCHFKLSNNNKKSRSKTKLMKHDKRSTIDIRKLVNIKKCSEKVYSCSHCNYVTKRASNLIRHVSYKHNAKGKTRCRQHCIIENGQVKEHEDNITNSDCLCRSLTPVKEHACLHCEYSTGQKGDLKKHIMAKHSRERPYCCPYCQYASVRMKELRNHLMARHTKERPRQCDYCEYRAVEAGVLKTHIMAKHTHDRPHRCAHCSYSAVQLGTLKLHVMAKHTERKPHSCPFCVYSAVQAGVLKRHIKARHTADKAHSCPYCPYKAIEAGAVNRHVLRRHILTVTIRSGECPQEEQQDKASHTPPTLFT